MNSQTDHGFLVLADVSGFTAFVTTTELEHGSQIIAALLDEVVAHLSPPLEIQEIEGDAVFALGGVASRLTAAGVLEALEGAFVAFKTRQREMQGAETCLCNACQRIWTLDLKMVVHQGPFLRHTVGGRKRVTGTAVILVHRLLKNRVPRKGGYALLTEPVVRSLGLEIERAGLPAHTERYEHLGDVRCVVRELSPLDVKPLDVSPLDVEPLTLPSPQRGEGDVTLSPEGRGQGEGAREPQPQAIA